MTDLSTPNLQRLLAEATPGPWEVDQFEEQFVDCPEVTEFYLCSEDMQYIAKGEAVSKYRDREEANFRLIALAPELAAEVIRLHEALTELRDDLAEDGEKIGADSYEQCEFISHGRLARKLTRILENKQ